MYLKSTLLVFCFLIIATNCWGQNSIEHDNLVKLNAHYPKIKLQSFKITFRDSWFGKDKADHLLVSGFLTAMSFYVFKEEQNYSKTKSLNLSIASAFSIGVLKEIRDGLLTNRAASVKDLVADILGIGIGVFLFNIE